VPLIDLTVPAGAVAPDTVKTLTEELATTLLRWEGAPDTEFFRQITWVYVHEIAAEHLAVGGRAGGAPRFRVEITVPEGALSQRRKDGLVADIHQLVTAAAGIDPAGERARHVWTLIREVPDGNWAAGGRVVRFADLKQIATGERAQLAEG
jgi:phenylpyruvate tautomerase PptA (4-oxalocrotonate tautomerase family)